MSSVEKKETGATIFRVEIIISEILRWGVTLSLTLMVLGTVLTFATTQNYGTGGGTAEDLQRLITSDDEVAYSFAWLWNGIVQLDGHAILTLGLLLLIATPVLRVLVSVLAYVRERDWRYVAITTTVLILLAVSFLLGKVE